MQVSRRASRFLTAARQTDRQIQPLATMTPSLASQAPASPYEQHHLQSSQPRYLPEGVTSFLSHWANFEAFNSRFCPLWLMATC